MSKEGYFGSALGLFTILCAVVQGMYPLIPPIIGWPLVGVSGAGAIVLFVIGIRKKEHTKEKSVDGRYTEEWQHFKNLAGFIIEMENIPVDKWPEVRAKMQLIQNALCDKQLDEIMTLYYNVLDESKQVGLTQTSMMTNVILEKIRKYVGKKYKMKLR